jgi:outer membrane protein TolC
MPFFFHRWAHLSARPKVMRALCATCLVISFSAGAQAQTIIAQPLTLDAALVVAQARSKALPAQDAAARAAREQAVAAGRLPDPMLRLSVDNLPVDGPKSFSLTDDFMTMRSVGLTQTLTRADKRHARAALFERVADSAQAARGMQLANLRRDTAFAWFDRYFQQQMVDLLAQQRGEARLQIESADAAYRAGRGAQADAFLARSAVARIDDRMRQARAQLANASTTLERWVGDVATAPLGDPPPISQTRMATQMLKNQLDQHPDIVLMASKEAIALADAEVARQDQQADWSVSLMYSQRGPAFSNMASFVVSVPLQWDLKNRQNRELAATLAKVEQAQSEREEMARTRLAEMQRWLETWRSDVERLSHYDTSLIPLATDRTRAALAAYRGGKATLSSVVEARRMEIDTRIERLRIEMETASFWVELEYLIPAQHAAAPSISPYPPSTLEK